MHGSGFGPWPKDPKGNYRPREPSSQVLFQVLAEGLEDFLERIDIESGGRGLPSFVVDELRGFLSCGDLRGGFARFKCRGCGYERLLPFSCKGRGFCSLCFVVSYPSDLKLQFREYCISQSELAFCQ